MFDKLIPPEIIPTPASSNVFGFYYLDALDWDLDRNELHVFFQDKNNPSQWASHYVYYDVSEKVYDEIFSASSKGKFVHRVLKGGYDYRLVEKRN